MATQLNPFHTGDALIGNYGDFGEVGVVVGSGMQHAYGGDFVVNHIRWVNGGLSLQSPGSTRLYCPKEKLL